MGPPPPTGVETLEWIATNKSLLQWTPELTFFAIGFLVPATVALDQEVSRAHRVSSVVGCGMFAIAIPLLVVLLVLQGRLVYPVFGSVVHTPDLAQLVVVTYYGGLHAASLLFAIGTVVLSVAMRRGTFGRPTAYFDIATGALDVVGSYPDGIGPTPWLVCGTFFAAWFVAVGVRLYALSAGSPTSAQRTTLAPRYT